jgi:hypothetical protein
MPDDHRRARAAALVATAGRRTAAERDDLVAVLRAHCWPGGGTDRTEPAARAWVRRWRPERLGAVVPRCTCRQGSCVLCN